MYLGTETFNRIDRTEFLADFYDETFFKLVFGSYYSLLHRCSIWFNCQSYQFHSAVFIGNTSSTMTWKRLLLAIV